MGMLRRPPRIDWNAAQHHGARFAVVWTYVQDPVAPLVQRVEIMVLDSGHSGRFGVPHFGPPVHSKTRQEGES
jgi:hypothetical protein